MKTKILSMFLITAILAVSAVLAATSNPSALTITDPSTSASFTLEALTNTANYSITSPTITQENGAAITFSYSTGTSFTASGTSQSVTLTTNVNYDELSLGKDYSGNIVVTNTALATDTVSIPVSFSPSFCKEGEQGTDLEITDVKVDNNDGDDDEWSPLDEIEVEVEVSNDGDEKIKDVFVEIALFDSEGKDVTKDLEDLDDEEIDLGSIKDDDEDTATFTFTVPADFEDDNYRLFVKAYSDDLEEENECTGESSDLSDDTYESINGEREEDEENHIIFNNIQVSPSPAQCGERVQVTGEVFNIGDEDYEDQVKVTLTSTELGVNVEKIVREDFDQGDSELVEFEFDIPAEMDEKLYTLEFRTFYDYDEDDDTYDITSDDKFTSSVRVGGNCKLETTSAQITAQLDSETPEAVAGRQIVINSRIRNTGDVETTYSLSVTGNSGWSSIVSLDPQVVILQPGESRDVNIVLSVDDDASGDNELTIRAAYEGQITDQRVVLSVAGSGSGGSATQSDLGPFVNHIRNNWFIYLIVLVNIILIIAIILVIRSMVSPRPL